MEERRDTHIHTYIHIYTHTYTYTQTYMTHLPEGAMLTDPIKAEQEEDSTGCKSGIPPHHSAPPSQERFSADAIFRPADARLARCACKAQERSNQHEEGDEQHTHKAQGGEHKKKLEYLLNRKAGSEITKGIDGARRGDGAEDSGEGGR